MASSLVTVIVPVYNDEQFLKDCLESIVKQTYEPIEVLCVNFGASEKCADILSDYAHKYKNIQIFTLKEGGKATAKNLGLKKAKGDLVFFLDADDKIDKTCIEELVKTQTRTNADVVCVHDIVICEGKKKTAKDRMISGHSEGTFQITNEIVNQMWVVAWGKLFKIKPIRDLELSFPEGCLYDDEFFHFALLPHLRKIAVSDGGTVFYRQHENSVVARQKLKSGKDNLLIFQKIFEYYQENGFLGKIDLPVRILSSGFAQNANHKLYYQQVKDLLCHLGVSKEMVNHHELVGKLLESDDFLSYCRCATCYKIKQSLQNLGQSWFRCQIGKKTHIALFGLTLLHFAKGEKTVILGLKL